MPSKKPTITIRVTDEEYKVLQGWADKDYRTVPSLVLALTKKAIDDYTQQNHHGKSA
ncbi:MAG TPA: hypothetical protein VE944_32415 [Nostoc sp.]|uniref:hypothetical protein n=1 Tax=Nostoc sp. TaxID=1180 RepID=UPI002D27FE39|nr:hypothetical protein [Nostoc sp.]HYX18975.1 hypothetical protein [Nostoc sp.]